MGQVFDVTHPIDTVQTIVSQSLDDVVDVSAFDEIAVYTQLVSAPSPGSITLDLWTGISLYDLAQQSVAYPPGGTIPSDWIKITNHGSWTSDSANAFDLFQKGGFLRYLGWTVTALGFSSASFIIRGVGRTYARPQGQ